MRETSGHKRPDLTDDLGIPPWSNRSVRSPHPLGDNDNKINGRKKRTERKGNNEWRERNGIEEQDQSHEYDQSRLMSRSWSDSRNKNGS